MTSLGMDHSTVEDKLDIVDLASLRKNLDKVSCNAGFLSDY